MSDIAILAQRIERLEPAVGEIRDRLSNCLLVADRRPADAFTLARGVAETIAKRVLADIGLKPPAMLDASLRDLEAPRVMSRGLVPAEVLTLLHTVRVLGNKASHDAMRIEATPADVDLVLRAVLRVVEWYFAEFDRGPKLNPLFRPGAPLSPRVTHVPGVRMPPLLVAAGQSEGFEQTVFVFTDRLIGFGREKTSRDPRVHVVTRLLPCPGPHHPNWAANLETLGQFHAQLWWQMGRVEIRDEASARGVLLDGRPIARGVWTLCSLPHPARVALGHGGVEFTVSEVVRVVDGTEVPCVRLTRVGNWPYHEYLLVGRPVVTIGSDPGGVIHLPGTAPLVATVVAGENGWVVRLADGIEKQLLPNRPSEILVGGPITVSLADEADFLH